jgi:hypothetical protein
MFYSSFTGVVEIMLYPACSAAIPLNELLVRDYLQSEAALMEIRFGREKSQGVSSSAHS